MIKRPKSNPHEPEVSDRQREDLLTLIQREVERHHGVIGYDPVVAMALIATDPVVNGLAPDPLTAVPANPAKGLEAIPPVIRRDRKTALDAHKEVAKYTRPQLKQVEVSGLGGGPIIMKSGLASEIADLIAALSGTTAEKGSTQT